MLVVRDQDLTPDEYVGAMRALFSPDADPDTIARYANCEALTPGWRDRPRTHGRMG